MCSVSKSKFGSLQNDKVLWVESRFEDENGDLLPGGKEYVEMTELIDGLLLI